MPISLRRAERRHRAPSGGSTPRFPMFAGTGGLRELSGLAMRVGVRVRELQGSTLVGGEARADNVI